MDLGSILRQTTRKEYLHRSARKSLHNVNPSRKHNRRLNIRTCTHE